MLSTLQFEMMERKEKEMAQSLVFMQENSQCFGHCVLSKLT
jgi:hypothetical protein